MSDTFARLLRLVKAPGEREALLEMGRAYHRAARGAASARKAGAPSPEALLDQILARLQWHLKAMRYPLPTRSDLAAMLDRELGGEGRPGSG